MKFRLPYDDVENARIDKLTDIDFTGTTSMTLQAPAEEQDINVIMKRFGVKDGSRIPRWEDANAMYGDFSELPTDPVEAAEYIRQGNVSFAALPAKVRKQFESGAHLHNWLLDPKNAKEAEQLGLLERRPPPKATLDDVRSSLDKMTREPVSSSTSSDKGSLVPLSNPPKEEVKK